jgi:hypothetical protein
VPAELDAAVAHLDERRREEATIIDMAEERLDEVRDRAVRGTLVRLIDLIGQCRLTAIALHRRIMDARPTFLREQDRQVLARLRPVCLVSPETDLLPAALTVREAATGPFAAFTRLLLGPRPRPVLDVGMLVAALGRPRRSTVEPPAPPADPELRPVPAVTARFSDAERAAAQELLAGVQALTLLSRVLERAADHGPNVMLPVGLRALAAVDTATLVRGPVLARPAGSPLDAGWLWGDDLQLVPNAPSAASEEPGEPEDAA